MFINERYITRVDASDLLNLKRAASIKDLVELLLAYGGGKDGRRRVLSLQNWLKEEKMS